MTSERRIKRGWMNLRVSKIIHETHDCRTLILVDDEEGGRSFDYIAGQYLTFRFDSLADKPLVRSYTMSSSPLEDDHIAVTIKMTADPYVSRYLTEEIKLGDVLRARGPMGKFSYHPDSDPTHLVMIAAGSGVTPFISIMREFAGRLGSEGAPRQMTLVVGFRRQEDIICHRLLTAWRKIPGVDIYICLSREPAETGPEFHHGRIDARYLAEVLPQDLSSVSFMTCGPVAMMQTAIEFLRDKRVDEARIHTESFT